MTMTNLALRKLANLRIFLGMFVSALLAPALFAQATPQLQVELGPNHEIRIVASDVSYGEVLRALQKKLGWEIEFPAVADELKVSSVHIETTEPAMALAKLLEGSRLGYALRVGENKSQSVKVVVTSLTPREASANRETASSAPIPDQVAAGASSPPLAPPASGVTPIEPTAPVTDAEQPQALSTMPLSEAINAMGVPPGVSPADVGRTMTLPISEAARIMGVPPGVSPGDVGKTTIMPLPTGSGKRP